MPDAAGCKILRARNCDPRGKRSLRRTAIKPVAFGAWPMKAVQTTGCYWVPYSCSWWAAARSQSTIS